MAAIVIACEKKAAEKEQPESVTLPMELTYKAVPEIGSMRNVQTIMEWNKRISDMNFDVADLLADSVTIHLADGLEMTYSRDSTIAFVRKLTGEMSKIDIIHTAAFPINAVNMGHEWVVSWTDETYTMKNGDVEHSFLHEDYRLEKGKIREIFQYVRKPASSEIAQR